MVAAAAATIVSGVVLSSPSVHQLTLWLSTHAGEVRCRKLGVQRVNVTDSVRLLGDCGQRDPLAAVHAYNR